MLNHLDNCSKYLYIKGKTDKKQSHLSFESKNNVESKDITLAKYSEKKIRASLAKMVVVDELPFLIVEGEGFKEFVKTLEPRFPMPSRYTVMRDVMKLFLREKEELKAMFFTSG